MQYFKSGDLLISKHTELTTAVVKNNISKESDLIPGEVFSSMVKEELKPEKFNELLNLYYKNNKETWTRNGIDYRSMENFEVNKLGECTNYPENKIPLHWISSEKYEFEGWCHLIYYQGSVFYLHWGLGSDSRSRLVDAITFEPMKWVRAKHCSPIMNLTERKIM